MASLASKSTGAGAGTAAGLAAVALWSWTGPCLAAGTRGLGALPFLAITSAVGAATGALFHVLRGNRLRDLVALPPRVLVAGFFGVAVYTLLLTVAVGLADEADLAQIVLVNYLWPVLVVLLGVALRVDRARPATALAAAALGFAGVVASLGPEAFARPAGSLAPHGLALVGATFWSLYSVLLRRWRVPIESCGSTIQFAACAAMAAALAGSGWQALAARPGVAAGLVVAVVHGIGPVGLGYALWEIGMKRGDARVVAVAANFIPLANAGLVALLFHEAASPWLIPGALLITAGALVARRASRA
jgi:drug/metabolite transporter (DMT)-like permease